jgi:PAS domain S-box-containing protein
MKQPLKILLLEDSRTDAEIIHRLLKKEMPRVEFSLAMNKKEFLKALEEFAPDVILSDNSLPQFNASEALVIVQKKILHVPFILITGTVSEEYAANIIKQGADDYILKDRMTRLPASIDAALQRRQNEKEKLEAAKQLKRSEENYRTIMERVSDGFVALDKNWCYTYLNKKAGEIMHRDPVELIGKHIWTEFPEGIDQPFYKAYHEAMEKQEYMHLEKYYSPFDSWLENHIYPSPDGLSIFFRDITARKKAEQKIIQSEENLKAIFDNSSEGFVLLDEQSVVKAFNNKASQSILITIDEEIETGRDIFDFVEKQRRPLVKEVISKVMQGSTIQYDRLYNRPDGTIAWINFSFNPVRMDDHIKGVCMTIRDITEKKIAEHQKEFDNNNLHALINNTHDLMWSVDRNLKLITSNQAFDKIVKVLSGSTPEKGENILTDGFSNEQLERYKKYYERAFAGETFTEIEYSHDFWSEISFYPIYERNAVIGTACFSRNITDRKKAEHLLQKSFIEKQALAERVSAILNTLPANIALLDGKGVIVDVNDAWRNFTDTNGFIGSNYGIGDNYIDISKNTFGADKPDGKVVATGLKTVLTHKAKEFVFEYSSHSPGVKRWFRMVVTPLLEKEYAGAVVMHIDISELRRLEEERLVSRMEEQKKITRAMLSAQEKERHAIGIELHDNVNQIIVGTNMMLSQVKNNPEKHKELIALCMNSLQDAIRENRKIAHSFVAPDSDTEDLVDQLKYLVENMLTPAGMKVTISSAKFRENLLDSEKKTNIYRVAQEQCTNIVKYAKASVVKIILTTTGGSFKMTIADNGIGMNANKKATGIGLRNINGRLSIFNGSVNIITAPGKGFALEISIPL